MAEQMALAEIEFATNPEPRCPCVLLIDTSGSMSQIVADAGSDLGYNVTRDGKTYRAVSGGVTKIDKVNEGLKAFHEALKTDLLAMQRVEISVITFGGKVNAVTPFISAQQFEPPTLSADGETPMGAAIELAIDAIEERKQLYKRSGLHYFRPWIFMMTDGEPTDAWQSAAKRVLAAERSRAIAFFAIGVPPADFGILKQISTTREPLQLQGYNFREMFIWLSSSLRRVSQSQPGQEVPLLPPTGWGSV
jgi:uncharacterized protein YegL